MISVDTSPGQMAVARMPLIALLHVQALRSDAVKRRASRPYRPDRSGSSGRTPAQEEILMICPSLRARIAGQHGLGAIETARPRSRAGPAPSPASEISGQWRFGTLSPALLTRMSTSPWSLAIRAPVIAHRVMASDDIEHFDGAHPSPSAMACSGSGRRPDITTSASSLAEPARSRRTDAGAATGDPGQFPCIDRA